MYFEYVQAAFPVDNIIEIAEFLPVYPNLLSSENHFYKYRRISLKSIKKTGKLMKSLIIIKKNEYIYGVNIDSLLLMYLLNYSSL